MSAAPDSLLPPRPWTVGLLCPTCGCPDLRVLHTRAARGFIRRRRECTGCGLRMTTREEIAGTGREAG